MQLEPSSIAYTTLVLPIVMIGLKKNLVHPSQPIRFQSKPSHDLTPHVFPRFKWLACFDFEFSLPPWNITQWSGGSSGLLYIHSASKSRTHLWRSGVGYCHDRNFFFSPGQCKSPLQRKTGALPQEHLFLSSTQDSSVYAVKGKR